MARILVTGGAGFIGSHLVDALLTAGASVRVLDSLVPQVHGAAVRPRYLPPDVEFIHADVRDQAALERALAGVEVVFHQAAEVGVGQSMYAINRYVGANTGATANLLETLVNRRGKVQKLVVASSMSNYGEGAYHCAEHGAVAPQLRPPAQLAARDWEMRCPLCRAVVTPLATAESKPLRPTSIYAITKMDQELMTLAIGRAYELPVVALRYFNVYGPRQSLSNPYTGIAAIFGGRLLNGRAPLIFEDGRQLRDFIHVHDIVRANMLAMQTSAADYQVINVGTGRALSVLGVAQTLIREFGVAVAPEIVGKFRAGDIRHCYSDPRLAHDLLGFQAEVTFEAGMAELVGWMREQQAVDRLDAAASELAERGLTR